MRNKNKDVSGRSRPHQDKPGPAVRGFWFRWFRLRVCAHRDILCLGGYMVIWGYRAPESTLLAKHLGHIQGLKTTKQSPAASAAPHPIGWYGLYVSYTYHLPNSSILARACSLKLPFSTPDDTRGMGMSRCTRYTRTHGWGEGGGVTTLSRLFLYHVLYSSFSSTLSLFVLYIHTGIRLRTLAVKSISA